MCLTDVAVAFRQSTFIGSENSGLVQPALVLSNQASYEITVIVSTIDNNASGELHVCVHVCVGCMCLCAYVCLCWVHVYMHV